MYDESQHRDLIDKYLQGTLSDTEREQFELLLNDPEIRQQVMEEKTVIAALQAHEKYNLKNRLKEFSSQIPVDAESTPTNKRIRIWLSAASLILLFTLAYFFYIQSQPISEQFNNYYEIYPATSVQRGEATDIEEGLRLYGQKEYEQAISHLNSAASPEKPLYYLYLGNAYIQLQKPQKAADNFEKLIEFSDDSILKQHAEWYLTLCFLLQNNESTVNAKLLNIMAEEGIYSDMAQQLYNEIN